MHEEKSNLNEEEISLKFKVKKSELGIGSNTNKINFI
jgi:hypothetical protein